MQKIAFYGGTFDPPHDGHLGMALAALESGRTGNVMFVPAYDPPHKPGMPRSSFRDRYQMVNLLIDGRDQLEVSDIEARLKLEPSYTVEVLTALEKEMPGVRFQLLIGGDSLAQLHTWYRAEELAERYEILTYPRVGTMPDESTLIVHWGPERAKKLHDGILEGDFFEISSTILRNCVANGAEMRHIYNRIPERVQNYIRRNRLYES